MMIIRKLSFVLSCALAVWVLPAGCSSDTAGPNRAPVADAGADLTVNAGEIATLDGSGSFDPDGDALTYHWSLLAAPGIDAPIAGDDRTGIATFTPDVSGLWVVALVVDDGRLSSEPDIVQVRVTGCGDCDDGIYCNGVESCADGKCEPGTALPNGTACTDDDLFCTGPEQCQAGACVSMGNPCPVPADCDEQEDTCGDCGNGVVDNGEQCDPGAPRSDNCCDVGSCTWTPAGEVDPQGFCSGAPECRLDVCDGSGACTTANVTDGTACTDDGSFCTGAEECLGGVCASTGDPCPGTECNTCNEVDDSCFDSAGTPCTDDGVFCTGTEECNGSGACMSTGNPCPETECNTCNETDNNCFTPPGTSCTDDGQYCTGPEECDGAGQCTGTGNPCAETECNTCNETDDNCFTLSGTSCTDDGLFCTGPEECNGSGACVSTGDPCPGTECNTCNELDNNCFTSSGTSCTDDGLFCTGPEECNGSGTCASKGNPCAVQADCDEINDICGACGDGTLSGGEDCDPGAPLNDYCCDVGNCQWATGGSPDPQGSCAGAPECQVDVCDGAGGCGTANEVDGTPCTNDGLFCSGLEECSGGACVSRGDPCPNTECNTCNETDNNCFTPSGTSCTDDGLFCSGPEECNGSGACVSTGDSCPGTECNTCNETADNCFTPSGTSCTEDGLFCSGPEECNGTGACMSTVDPCPNTECNTCNEIDNNCFTPSGTSCTDDGLFCSGPEECNGSGACVSTGDSCPGTECNTCNETDDNCFTSSGTSCTDDVLFCTGIEECDGLGACVGSGDPCTTGDACNNTCNEGSGDCFSPATTSCDDGDPCTSTAACDGIGNCIPGAIDKDADGDTFIDIACGGTDCDDGDPEVNTSKPEGPVCDPSSTCFDGKDNNCDNDTDTDDANCQATGYICVSGPANQVPTGAPGDTITVRLDGSSYDPGQIVCYTDTGRLLPVNNLLANDFESDMARFSISDAARVGRSNWAQSPFSPGLMGAYICSDGDWLMTDPIDTTGRTRIRLRYAATSWGLDNQEYSITEYSPDGGGTWYVLDISGDNYNQYWQWYTHVLPPSCENVTNLRIRFRRRAGDNNECTFVDDVSIDDLPDPTVGWTVLSNHFETSEGNSPADICNGETITVFTSQGDDADICLRSDAQNPVTGGSQGVRIADNQPSYLTDPDVNTTYVPAGSDLVSEFYMEEYGDPGNDSYANAWYYDGATWFRMNGVGVDTRDEYDWFRFVWEQDAIGISNAQVRFYIPAESNMNNGRGMYVDDYELNWYRASHDGIGAFTDQGDGTYTANIQSDLGGTANVTCIFYGAATPIKTDDTGDNSDSWPVDFNATYGSLEFYLDDHAEASPVDLGAFTVECWAKLDTDQPGAESYEWIPLVEQADLAQQDVNGYGLSLIVFNRHVVGTIGSWSNLYEGTTTVTNNEWHHFAVTYDGNDMNIYLDGVPDGTKNYGVDLDLSGANRLEIGSSIDGGGDEWFSGNIDEVRIWDYARTGAEISAGMYIELAGGEPGLVRYWKFNEGSGQTSQDFAGGNDVQLGSTPAADADDPSWSPDRPFIP